MTTPYFEETATLLTRVLGLGARQYPLKPETPLLGAMPELDSMAVVQVLTALEDHFGIVVHDDEISAATFETVGTVAAYVAQKLN